MKVEEPVEKRIVRLADKILASEVDLLEGCRRLVQLAGLLDKRNDELLAPILGVESELDGYPLGAARHQWSIEALKKSDARKKRYLDEVRTEILDTCRALIAEYSVR